MKELPSQADQASGVFHHIFGIVGHVVRFRPARYPALAVLLAAVATLGAVFAVAEAREGDGFSAETADNPQQMTSQVLVSNIGQAEFARNLALATSEFAQRFTTGSSTTGFNVTSIDVRLRMASSTTDLPTVTLRSGSAAGTEVATFSTTRTALTGVRNITFNADSTARLSASTNYWVVLTGGPTSLRPTASNSEDSTSQSGWTIHNVGESRTVGAASFDNLAGGRSLMIRVKGTINPVLPNATGAPAITAPNVFRVPAVLSVDLSDIADPDGVTNIADTATYNWQRFDASGSTLETDAIGTDATYTLTDDDAGKTIKVQVSFDDDEDNAEGPRTSAATPQITAAAECAAPTYAGGATGIWTGKLAVGHGTVGSDDYYGSTEAFNALDVPAFTADFLHNFDTLYTVESAGEVDQLHISMENLNDLERRQLVLYVCDTPFAFRDATTQDTGSTISYSWTMADLDWTDHAERTLHISRDQAAPMVTEATVDGASLVITLSEDLAQPRAWPTPPSR